MSNSILMNLPGIDPEEMMFLQNLLKELREDQHQNFFMMYTRRRKDPQTILIMCLIGFIGIAGLQRFVLDQVGMGILYFITCGFCFIGSIYDIVNYRNMTMDYNKRAAIEAAAMIRVM